MSLELTVEQSEAIAANDDNVVLIDRRTGQSYRLIREEEFQRIQSLYDGSPWTPKEMALLAGAAFNKLDDEDYSHYLRDLS